MPDNLLKYNQQGEPSGIDIAAVKKWAEKTTPAHADLEPYLLVHFKAKTAYLEELAKQTAPWHIIVWKQEITRALEYLEQLIDAILEADETTYNCDLRQHWAGEICPNRRNLVLPEPDANTDAN